MSERDQDSPPPQDALAHSISLDHINIDRVHVEDDLGYEGRNGTESERDFDYLPGMAPVDISAREVLINQFLETIKPLSGREKEVLRRRFGIDTGHAETLEEVGRELGMQERGKPLSKERIRQIEEGALKKLRQGGPVRPESLYL